MPVQISIAPEDIANDQENPMPLYTFVNRVHYIGLLIPKIHKFFFRYAPLPLCEKDIWLEW